MNLEGMIGPRTKEEVINIVGDYKGKASRKMIAKGCYGSVATLNT